MKVLSKPLSSSSPGRTEKLPTPLMARLFLRRNVGSRSIRGRAVVRSSPMFYNLRSKKNAMIENAHQQEPTSPKVTCIGQVRVRRSKKGKKRSGASVNRRRRWWRWWRSFSCRKVESLRHIWNKKILRRVFCVGWGYCRKVDASEDSFTACDRRRSGGDKNGSFAAGDYCNNNSSSSNRVRSFSESDDDDGFRRSCSANNLEISSSKRGLLLEDERSSCNSSPPKNALLLTRCRSAPYRSSSLGGKFWNSPSTEAKGDDAHGEEDDQNRRLENSEEAPRISEESSSSSSKKLHELRSNSIHPLLLTRCKSEPARTGVRLVDG